MGSKIGAPQAVSAASRRPPQTYWQLVTKQFLRNRLATVGGVVVLVLFTLAVFANALANGYPLFARLQNPHIYATDYEGWKVNHRFLVEDLQRQPANPEAGQRLHRQVMDGLDRADLKLGQMSLQLGGRSLQFADHVRDTYSRLRRASTEQWPDAARMLQKQARHAPRFLAPGQARLETRDYYPLLRNIRGEEVFFAVFFLLVLGVLFGAGRLVGAVLGAVGVGSERAGALLLLLVLGLPVAAGLAWDRAYPETSDKTPYHALASQPGARILFLPIAYFPDEAIPGTPTNLPPSWSAEYQPRLLEEARRAQAEGRAPYWPPRPHYLGTDEYGYDVASRMIWGARISLSVGFVAVSIYAVIGVILGAMAGYFQGWIDMLISRVIEIMLCFPTLFLIIIIMAYLPPSVFNVMVVIGITGWPGVARLVRGEFLRLGTQEFVLSAQSLGIGTGRIIFRHILPNAMAPVLVVAAFGIAGAILTESALSYLGIGVPADTPSWGALLRGARDAPRDLWWLTLFPGMAVFVAVTSYNLVAEGVRDAIDPRLKE